MRHALYILWKIWNTFEMHLVCFWGTFNPSKQYIPGDMILKGGFYLNTIFACSWRLIDGYNHSSYPYWLSLSVGIFQSYSLFGKISLFGFICTFKGVPGRSRSMTSVERRYDVYVSVNTFSTLVLWISGVQNFSACNLLLNLWAINRSTGEWFSFSDCLI